MPNFVVQTALINGNYVNICVALTQNVNNPPKGLKQKCDILWIHTNGYLSPKKDSFFSLFHFISIEAITLCAHMDIDLSSIDNIKVAIGRRNEIIDKWEQIRIKCDNNWDKMCDYMAGKPIESVIQSTNIANGLDVSEIQMENLNSRNKVNFNILKKGDLVFEGITRSIIYSDDSISLNSNGINHLRVSVPSSKQGKEYTFNFDLNKPNINLFYTDIMAITIYEGYDPSTVKMELKYDTDYNAEVKAYKSIPFIRFVLNGINEPSGNVLLNRAIDLYAIPINRSQLNEVQELKIFLENKIRESRNSTSGNLSGSQSMADELLKYSLLMEKGIITADEYNSFKKKLLDL